MIYSLCQRSSPSSPSFSLIFPLIPTFMAERLKQPLPPWGAAPASLVPGGRETQGQRRHPNGRATPGDAELQVKKEEKTHQISNLDLVNSIYQRRKSYVYILYVCMYVYIYMCVYIYILRLHWAWLSTAVPLGRPKLMAQQVKHSPDTGYRYMYIYITRYMCVCIHSISLS